MTRNPDWTREEMVLALNLYHRVDALHLSAEDPAVIQLSQQLRTLPFHPPATRADTFRNPTGIVMTLRTFMRYDAKYGFRGLRGGALGRLLWSEFHERRTELHQLAESILAASVELQRLEPTAAESEEFFEGGVLFRWHRLRERNVRLVRRKKAEVLKASGRLKCEACSFDFADTYGPAGEGFIECHHRLPLNHSSVRRSVRVEDLALVCSNCHRILHRRQPMMSVDQLRDTLAERAGRS